MKENEKKYYEVWYFGKNSKKPRALEHSHFRNGYFTVDIYDSSDIYL